MAVSFQYTQFSKTALSIYGWKYGLHSCVVLDNASLYPIPPPHSPTPILSPVTARLFPTSVPQLFKSRGGLAGWGGLFIYLFMAVLGLHRCMHVGFL